MSVSFDPPARRGRRRTSDPEIGPDPVDVHVGARVRLRRILLGLSQGELGAALGLTFQQVQKYERGANRVSASKLYRIAQVLDVPVGFFFDDMPGAAPAPPGPDDLMLRRETLELMRHYYAIPPGWRRRVYDLVKSMAWPRREP